MPKIYGEIGPPGCGKGTALRSVIRPYCERHQIPLVVVPMSTEISAYLDEHHEIAQRVRTDMSLGRLVDDKVVIEVLKRCMPKIIPSERADEAVYVLDGMPRTMGQIETCLHGACKVFGVGLKDYMFLNFITPLELCGFRTANRKDDDRLEQPSEEVFMTRWDEFRSKTLPAVDFLRSNAERMGFGFLDINGRYLMSQPELAMSQIFGPE